MFNGEKHVHNYIITYIIIISITSLPHFFLPQKRSIFSVQQKPKKYK